MAKKIAVIDLGTNTFNLLIAEVENTHFKTIFHDKIGVALGMGGINEGKLAVDAIDRAMEALTYFKLKCDEFQVRDIRAFGTSAIRDAKNGSHFTKQVKEQLAIDVQIISGDEEAQLIYKGVNWFYDFSQPSMIMDIGGGSTEFILSDSNGIIKAMSLNIGVSRIYQQLKLSDPITPADILSIENWLEKQSEGKLDKISCPILIGSSGTFETLHELHFKEKFPKTNACLEMSIEQLNEVLSKIIASTLEERSKNQFIIPIRQIMIPIAAVKINWIIKKLQVQKLLISPGSLKEGALK